MQESFIGDLPVLFGGMLDDRLHEFGLGPERFDQNPLTAFLLAGKPWELAVFCFGFNHTLPCERWATGRTICGRDRSVPTPRTVPIRGMVLQELLVMCGT